MGRFSHYDTDEERLPEGMTRVGYDADTQVYTFQDVDGSYWESAPGNQYGQLTRVSGPFDDGDVEDSQPFLEPQPKTSWRHDMMPLLNFGVILGVAMLLFLWYLHWAATPKTVELKCAEGEDVYTVKAGDSCWDVSEARGVSVEDLLASNDGLDCQKLGIGKDICLPKVVE